MAMTDAAILRLVSIGAAVLMTGIAALLAASVVRSSSNTSDSRRWWVPILGFVLSGAIIYVGFRIFRSGYTWGSYL